MLRAMTPRGHLVASLVICCLLNGHIASGDPGPVYVNPSDAALVQEEAAPIDSTPQTGFVTQTVYGFLDFTTTIGNTIMVFSPHSSAVDGEKDKTTESAVNAVIDTKPVTSAKTQPPPTIKPSKTVTNVEKKASETTKKILTVVNVQSETPTVVSSKTNINLLPSTKVNIKEDVSSVVNLLPVPLTAQTKNVITKVQVVTGGATTKKPPIISSKVEVLKAPLASSSLEINSEPAIVHNNLGEPEYDFLSRQPSEFVEETYKVVNLKQSTKFHLKPRQTLEPKKATHRPDIHPTGLVTKLGGTVVKDGFTTVHETSVIGTYISGKYAQVLQSTSRITNHPKGGKINPSPSLRILKTVAPNLGKSSKHHHLEPTPVHEDSSESFHPKKPTGRSVPSKLKNKSREEEETRAVSQQPSYKKKLPPSLAAPRNLNVHHNTSHREHKSNKKNNRKRPRFASVSVPSEPPPTTTTTQGTSRKYQSRKQKSKPPPTQSTENNNFLRKGYKNRQIQPTNTEPLSENTSVYKFKLNRAPGRWQYKTTPKPRVTIRRQNDEEQYNTTLGTTSSPVDPHPHLNDIVTPQLRSDEVDSLVGSESIASITGDDSSVENKIDNPFPLETVKVEISTPPDFKDTYYEIATIKSPYTFQAGSVKNTRYITVTSTFEKILETPTTENISPTKSEPLTENILATSNNFDKDNNFLDSSIATLPPLYMASDMETPPLETVTETFSTTQTMLKTHILPAVFGQNDTSSYTLIQTYMVTRLVAATKTLPPMEAYHFNPSRILNEFNSHLDEAGSELNLELAFGDENENEADTHVRQKFPADLDLAKIGSNFDISEVDKSNLPMEIHLRSKKAHGPSTQKQKVTDPVPQQQTPNLTPEQLQQLAILRLLNPAAAAGLQQQQVITTSKPVVKVETVYESHVIPVFNGHSTILTTISKSLGVVTKTDYEFGTSTILPQLPQIPNLPIPPPLFPQQQPQFTVTSSPVVQTTQVTQTSSKVLKLTFGARTAYTTIISTTVVPTILTTFVTASIPVQPTAAFPGFFSAPYAQFPYVG